MKRIDEMASAGRLRETARSAGGAIVIACMMVIAGSAGASPTTTNPIIVLEVYGGRRPANVDRFMTPLRAALERHGFAARPETIHKLFGGRLPRPGILDKGVTADVILKLVDGGYEDFAHARFDDAVGKLTDAVGKIERNSALLVQDAGNQEAVYKAHVGLALSQVKLGLTEQAAATMAELVRMFRTQPISRSEHGPTAEQFARKVYKEVSGKERGHLRISTGNPRAMIFVDRQFRGVGKTELEDLIPGRYRVLVQEPQSVGLVYEVEVPEGGHVELDARWEVDTSLIVTSQWIGFELGNDVERRKEASYGASVAERLSGRKSFAVVGTMKLQGRPALIGTLYSTTGTVLRSAVIVLGDALDDADDATLGALAKFLADGTPAAGIDIFVGNGRVAPASPVRSRSALPDKLLVGAGAAAVIAGGVLYAYDEDVNLMGPQPVMYFDSAKLGVAIGVTGVVVIAVGGWLWTRSGRRTPVPFVSVERSAGMIGLAWHR